MISHKHQFIFIHFPRTGGSVFEQAYRRIYDTENDPREEIMGENPKHFSASDYEKHFPGLMEQFYTFGFLRNPYELMVSIYFNSMSYKDISFSEFIVGDSARSKLLEYNEFFFCNDSLAVKSFLSFENYDKDMVSLCSTLGIELPVRKFNVQELEEKYSDLDFSEYQRINECVETALRRYEEKTGNCLIAPSVADGDYTAYKKFVSRHIDKIGGLFLNSYQQKITQAYICSEQKEFPSKRELDFYTYYRDLPNLSSIIELFGQSCPRIFELGKYDFELHGFK